VNGSDRELEKLDPAFETENSIGLVNVALLGTVQVAIVALMYVAGATILLLFVVNLQVEPL
jgi:hypothetical protein